MAEIRQADLDRLEYVSTMLAELRRMAACENCGTLSYLIEMAYLEAREVIERDDASGRRGDKRDAVA
ncbi:MAG: hypothetical protein WAU86_12245 [Oricola sp.]